MKSFLLALTSFFFISTSQAGLINVHCDPVAKRENGTYVYVQADWGLIIHRTTMKVEDQGQFDDDFDSIQTVVSSRVSPTEDDHFIKVTYALRDGTLASISTLGQKINVEHKLVQKVLAHYTDRSLENGKTTTLACDQGILLMKNYSLFSF